MVTVGKSFDAEIHDETQLTVKKGSLFLLLWRQPASEELVFFSFKTRVSSEAA